MRAVGSVPSRTSWHRSAAGICTWASQCGGALVASTSSHGTRMPSLHAVRAHGTIHGCCARSSLTRSDGSCASPWCCHSRTMVICSPYVVRRGSRWSTCCAPRCRSWPSERSGLRHRLDGHLHWPAPLQSWLIERAASLRHADVEDAMPLAMILEVWVSAELARRAAIDAAADVAAAADSVAAACAAGWYEAVACDTERVGCSVDDTSDADFFALLADELSAIGSPPMRPSRTHPLPSSESAPSASRTCCLESPPSPSAAAIPSTPCALPTS